MMEGEDGLLLSGREPMVARNPTVVFIDFAVPLLPVVELAGLNAQPGDDLLGRDIGPLRPMPNIVDQRIAGIVGNPDSV